ncbi:MAG: HDOD domain-containing protein [Burkholderiales bacterium]|nr:HDOD domain-containing protein [Burkholderiales bacterium]
MQPLVATLDAAELPVLGATLVSMIQLKRDEERVSGREISRMVLRDPLMALRVLRFAQARKTERQPTEITTIEHAVMMHGVTRFFREFAAMPSLEQTFAQDPVALRGALAVISRAQHAATYARAIAGQRADLESDEVTIGALLHDLAELLLWCHQPQAEAQIDYLLTHARGLRSASAQKVVLGFTHEDLQLALASAWKLPQMLQLLMDGHHATRPRVRNVLVGVAIARHSARGWHDPALPDDFKATRELLGLTDDQTWRLIRQAALQAANDWKIYGVRPAAAWLPALPGQVPVESGGPHRVDVQVFRSTLQRIGELPTDTEPAAAAALAMYGLQVGLGLRRVLYAEVNAKTQVVQPRFCFADGDDGAPWYQLAFRLGDADLLSRLMNKMQGAWIGGDNYARLAKLLDPGQRSRIGGGEFLAFSLFSGSEPRGFILADRGASNLPIPETLYAPFKALCLALAQRLGVPRPVA